MKKTIAFLKNPCVWYLFAWSLYLLQGTLYESGSIISQFLLFFILATSVVHSIRVFQEPHKPHFFKGLNVLVLMYTIYGLLLLISDGTMVYGKVISMPSLFYLKGYYMGLLPIYSCYYYTRRGYLSESLLSIFSVLFICVGILVFFRTQRELIELLSERGREVSEVTNNSGYVMLSIIPSLLVLNKKPFIQYIGIGICVAFILLAMKRGAILCVGVFLMMFSWHKMETSHGGRRALVVVFILIGFFLLTGFVQRLLENSNYFMTRIEETRMGDSSERNSIYASFLQLYLHETKPLRQIFGYGAYGTIKVGSAFAHNDWIETLINQGLLGILIFFTYCLFFYKTVRMKSRHPESRFALLVIFVFFLLQTVFSASITNTTIFTCSMMGFALADGFSYKIEE